MWRILYTYLSGTARCIKWPRLGAVSVGHIRNKTWTLFYYLMIKYGLINTNTFSTIHSNRETEEWSQNGLTTSHKLRRIVKFICFANNILKIPNCKILYYLLCSFVFAHKKQYFTAITLSVWPQTKMTSATWILCFCIEIHIYFLDKCY